MTIENYDLETLKNIKKFNEIYLNDDEIQIWEELDNGCYIGTLGYSIENIYVLQSLLQSFAEQYGEEIDYDAAKEELNLYQDRGKLFIYFDQNMKPVSMNGCIYNEDNISVDFKSDNKSNPSSLYFYGLSTLHEFRGRGACTELVKYASLYAYYNNFDFVYARTDLKDSNSESIMKKAGLEICTFDDQIIAEWVDVTDTKGDYRLHMWMPLSKGLYTKPKKDAYLADLNTREINNKSRQLKKVI